MKVILYCTVYFCRLITHNNIINR